MQKYMVGTLSGDTPPPQKDSGSQTGAPLGDHLALVEEVIGVLPETEDLASQPKVDKL